MLAAVAAGAGHPVVAALLGLGAAGVAGAVVAMSWNLHLRQIRLAEYLARRQVMVAGEAAAEPARGGGPPNGHGEMEPGQGRLDPGQGGLDPSPAGRPGGPAAVVIEGPDTVVTGEPARFWVRVPGGEQAVSWSAGGGAVSQAPDPARPGGLLLVADQPGSLTVSARVRHGMTERRAIKRITAVPPVAPAAVPVPLRALLNLWGLAAAAVLTAGLGAALAALGDLAPSAFIALASLLAALLAVTAVARGNGGNGPEAAGPLPGPGAVTQAPGHAPGASASRIPAARATAAAGSASGEPTRGSQFRS
jgi:hypothetical protein